MSWAKVISSVNSNIQTPLNELMEQRFEAMKRGFEEQLNQSVITLESKVTTVLTAIRRAEFDRPGEYSFTVPEGVYTLLVTACGGGGGGSAPNGGGNGGGGGAAIYKKDYAVTPRETIDITVGHAGGGGRYNPKATSHAATAGGATILSGAVNVTLSGGGLIAAGGSGGGNGGNAENGGSPGIVGSGGHSGNSNSTVPRSGGGGGGSLGHGGSGVGGARNDNSKPYRGGGGGGNAASADIAVSATSGADGYVEIEW